jgi:hypothetical protein
MAVAQFLVGLGLAGKMTVGATVAAAATVGGAAVVNSIPAEQAAPVAHERVNDVVPEAVLDRIGALGQHEVEAEVEVEAQGEGAGVGVEKEMPQAALPGLCNAWSSGDEAGRAEKAEAMAFQRLANMAAAAGKSGVTEFCEAYPKPGARGEAGAAVEGSGEGSRPEGKGRPEGAGTPASPSAVAKGLAGRP